MKIQKKEQKLQEKKQQLRLQQMTKVNISALTLDNFFASVCSMEIQTIRSYYQDLKKQYFSLIYLQ